MSLLHLFEFTSLSFLSSPETAEKCSNEIEKRLLFHKKVEIDFQNVHATEGFLEHLITPLLDKRGDVVLERLFFANCTDTSEYSINQVIKRFRHSALEKIPS